MNHSMRISYSIACCMRSGIVYNISVMRAIMVVIDVLTRPPHHSVHTEKIKCLQWDRGEVVVVIHAIVVDSPPDIHSLSLISC